MGLIELIQGGFRSKELEAGILKIVGKVRDKSGNISWRVKGLLETRWWGVNEAYVVFTKKGIIEFEKALGVKLEDGSRIKVVFKKLE